MWLINTQTLELEEKGANPPPYAILSHTWEDEEVLFRDMASGASSATKSKKGYAKIVETCKLASEDELGYAWVDTCCIDKSSSAELSEAINSMFQWYRNSNVCYVYLSDLPADRELAWELEKCRWFTRGWTLQELIAPRWLTFYDSSWKYRATKESQKSLISKITRIDEEYLKPGSSSYLEDASVARKMSWAANRETTRVEDLAYCLLGLFGINMPLLYGEGSQAFIRLQEVIIQKTNDLSLAAWSSSIPGGELYSGILASSIQAFRSCGNLTGDRLAEFSVTNRGIRITKQLLANTDPPHYGLYLGYEEGLDSSILYLVLQKTRDGDFVRDNGISGGIRRERCPIDVQNLGEQTIYLRRTSGFSIRQLDHDLTTLRRGGLQITWEEDLVIVAAEPQELWDSAHRVLLEGLRPALFVFRHVSPPYDSVAIIIIRDAFESVFMLSGLSPALPHIMKTLFSTTKEGLTHLWNLTPMWPNAKYTIAVSQWSGTNTYRTPTNELNVFLTGDVSKEYKLKNLTIKAASKSRWGLRAALNI